MFLGRDEIQPGTITAKVINPTEYDKAITSIMDEMHRLHTWDIFNPTLWKLIGFTGGPVKTWLTRYIQISKLWGESYTPFDADEWINYFVKNFGYEADIVSVYFEALYYLYDNGQISVNVYQPFNYTATDDSPAFSNPLDAGVNLVKFGMIVAVLGTVVYFSGKNVLKKLVK